MNLFKILANGHGNVSETNVSAFLGYLLDPTADHGLGYEFLNLFLGEVITDEDNLKELYQFDYQVFFEQKFKEPTRDKSETVDICLLCYETKDNGKSMSIMTDFISNNKEIKKVFLIENKIKGNPTKNQLSKQFSAFKEHFLILKPEFKTDNIHSIYITPETVNFNNEFKSNTDVIINKTHLHWNNNDDENNSIKNLLQQIISNEADYEIDPINEYVKHTIKAFIQFINNGFKSVKQEKKERGKNDGSYTKHYIKLNQDTNIEEKLTQLRNNLLRLNPKIEIYKPDLSRPRTPQLRIPYKGIFIELYGGFTSRNIIKLIYRLDKKNPDSINQLKLFCLKSGIELKSKNSKLAYCNINADNYPKFTINDYENISIGIKDAIELLNEHL